MADKPLPFGMFFEEPKVEPAADGTAPEYDALEGLSYVLDSEGHRIPYVTRGWTAIGTLTGTCTKAQDDSEDSDPEPPPTPKPPKAQHDSGQVPFGMLFEEQNTKQAQVMTMPEYNPDDSISYICDSTGQRVPFVEWARASLGTQTITAVADESSDTDPDPPRPLGTLTGTKVRAETTDAD